MKIKKILADTLCISMAFGNLTPAFAATTETDVSTYENTAEDISKETEVLYQQSASYFVTIPKTIVLGSDKQSAYSVKVEGDIPSDKEVYVSPIDSIADTEDFDFYMHDRNTNAPKDDVIATVTQNKLYWNFEDVADAHMETDNKVEAAGLSSGIWQGTFNFEISMRMSSSHIHSYEQNITKEAGCTETGEKTLTCVCGDTKTEVIPATGHNYVNGKCTECNEADPEHEHNYGENDRCTDCGALNPDHQHGYTENVTKEASCTEAGEKILTCACGDIKTETIKAKGHNYIGGICEDCEEVDSEYIPVIETLEDGISYNLGTSFSVKKNEILKINGSEVELAEDNSFTFNEEGEYTISVIAPNNNAYTITITITHNHNYEDGFCTTCGAADKEVFSKAGLYTATGKQLATWAELTEDYGFDISADVTRNTTKGKSVLQGTAVNPNGSNFVLVVKDDVTHIGNYALYQCDKLKTIVLPDGLESIGSTAFSGCSKLANIELPDGLTTIGGSAFANCTSLKNITIPNTVTNISSYAFSGDTSLSNVKMSNAITNIPSSCFANCTALTSFEIPESVTLIDSKAFYKSGIESIVIPENVETIGGYFSGVTYGAFAYCNNLKTVNVKSNNVTIKDGNFGMCDNLESAVFAGGTIECTFTNCPKLTHLEYGENVIQIARPVATSLEEIIVNENNTNYCDKDGIVFNKDVTELIAAPINKNYGAYTIPSTVTKVKKEAFKSCSKLLEIVIPENVKTIERNAFHSCKSLKKASISGVETIEGSTFYNCTSLTDVTIGDSVTTIEDRAFEACSAMKTIYIPSSVTTMHLNNSTGCMPFYRCSSSLKIYCGRSSASSNWDSVWNAYEVKTNTSGQITGTSNASTTYSITRAEYESTYKQ